MTVFIEYVFIDNLVIDYLLIKATFLLTGVSFSRGRLFLCAFLGAVFAVVYPLFVINQAILTAIKISFGVLLCFMSAKFKNKKEFYVCTVVFFLLTFALGGAIIGIFALFNIDYSSEICIALMIIPAYILIKCLTHVFAFIYKRKSVTGLIYKCKIHLGEKTFEVRGFLDTGNELYSQNSPVIVCEKKLFSAIINSAINSANKKAIKGETKRESPLPKVKKIFCQTAMGQSQMLTIKIDKLEIYIGQETNIFNNVVLGVASSSLGAGYDVILHASMLGGEKNESTSTNSIGKKVS